MPVILAAGIGRRMRPLSDSVHKTLMPLADETILGRILREVAAAGFSRATIVTGYRADEVMEYATAHASGLDLDFVHNPRYESTNNIHSLALAFEHVDTSEGILLVESDLVFEPGLLRLLLDSPHDNVALVDRYRPGMDGTVVQVGPDATIERIIPSDQQGPGFCFEDYFKTLNLYKFSGPFCVGTFGRLLRFYAREVSDNCFYELVLGMIVAAGQATIHAEVLSDQAWAEVDDPVDLRQARYLVDETSRRALLESSWGGWWGLPFTDFAFIRNMYFPTPAVLAELRMQLPELLHNYGSAQAELDQKLAWYLEVPTTEVVALNGASQVFPLLARHFQGRTVLVPEPTFGEWSRCFPDAHRYPEAHIPPHPPPGSVVVVVNPNNPTGRIHDTASLIADALRRPDVTYVVDESFIDFSDQPSALGGPPNVAVVKSLSKSLGVPGLRLGWLASTDTRIVSAVRNALPIWNLNSLAEKFIELLLKNRETVQASFQRTQRDREEFADLLGSLALVDVVMPSAANFLLVRLTVDSQSAADIADVLLSRNGLLVKDVSDRFTGQGHYRLAVRLPEQNRQLIEAMRNTHDR
jgi:histidinol-phosphate/aromatic aminotransferase/cobyric acid decarboxylase-like protein/choline kinase